MNDIPFYNQIKVKPLICGCYVPKSPSGLLKNDHIELYIFFAFPNIYIYIYTYIHVYVCIDNVLQIMHIKKLEPTINVKVSECIILY
jgi:hypothetical protein